MKTLSTNQIQHIEEFLISQYHIKYQDTRDEVLDHIACEIEELMNEGKEYDNAFKITFNKWNKDLSPHPWIRYKNVPSFLGRQWIKRDIISIILCMLIGLSIPYLLKEFIEHNNLANILGSSICLVSILLGGFICIKYFKVKGYRISQLKKDVLACGAISLFYYLMFIGGFTYKLLPLILIMCLYQVYYIIEIQKVRPLSKL
ncbi:hypothetical protein HX017_07090 [Myroides marinus]|uniref:hypothetical protein n=1 Tax=Myroides TaxID=76831 RepID=UPI000741EDDD|nr:hypothetical protein [Myroides marinus]KUF44282.1 hypothetical protein AS361_00675 [Myroides marinus]MDM1346597.1 hypothetical protein [Myroides marinus]MDM1350002.1 hypothetical protein [Myroides marinus]MDM1353509.1 hypothetical protein [Myroides marinus]MDM1357209.1 hypothetical protein [Myroides marinus]